MDEFKYYQCITRPDWYLIDDSIEEVIVQVGVDSVAIVEGYKYSDLQWKSITKSEIIKPMSLARSLIDTVARALKQ
jgi:hypothetical protein